VTQAEQRTWRRPPVVACIPVFNEVRGVDGVVVRVMRCMGGFE